MKMSFIQRFYIYQKERFPFLTHGILIAVFSFSAVAYSRMCRRAEGFIDWKIFAAGVFITITTFFLLRIFDEHKDAEDDAQHRRHLPVPRGLISLAELSRVGWVVVALQIAVIGYFFPKMYWLYALAMGYMLLMGKEFFVAEWLKKRQFWYVVSHMVIIPLVDIFASGLDWFLAGDFAPLGLLFFFAVSFMNGIVLEIGRKIRTPENEEVNTYSTSMGMERATRLWLWVLAATLVCSLAAAWFAGHGWVVFVVLGICFAAAAAVGFLFLQKPSARLAKWIEHASGLWTLMMYLCLGAAPMIFR